MRYEERYYLEQKLIPECLYGKESKQLMMGLLQGRGTFLIKLLNEIGKQTGYICPYDDNQFDFKPLLVGACGDVPEIAILMIDMPEPETMPICSKLIICHDERIERIQYYTVEKTVGIGKSMLCGVEENGQHKNYGETPKTEKELFQRVYELYTRFLQRKG